MATWPPAPPPQSLLETHDSVASKSYDTPPPSPCSFMDAAFNNQPVPPDAVRMVGIRKVSGEHLVGSTAGSKFRGGRGGDIIKEVNAKEVGNDPKVLQDMLKDASGSVVLKILPSYQEPHTPRQNLTAGVWMFGARSIKRSDSHEHLEQPKLEAVGENNVELVHDILEDLSPLMELSSAAGELARILQEPHFQTDSCSFSWKGRRGGGGGGKRRGEERRRRGGEKGMKGEWVELERVCERHHGFVGCPLSGPLCAGMGGKKKKRMMYLTTKNAEFDRHELRIYEEVAKVPPFKRKTLVLIVTSRKPKVNEKDGQMYLFMSRGEMEADIKSGRFLEHGEYDGNLYGTKINSIHEVVDTGRICILDVNPQALKILRTSEFLPYVVFIEAPDYEVLKAMNRLAIESGVVTKQMTDSELKRTVDESERIQRAYGHYFDIRIVNDGLESAFRSLRVALERLSTQQQWVPVSWVF
ncbi:hypothetical protein CRUP_021056 [Coryphaenoides rupestris]|nr:hypothetical protein CRUP_021056 [Coryphaenoides rupestris]